MDTRWYWIGGIALLVIAAAAWFLIGRGFDSQQTQNNEAGTNNFPQDMPYTQYTATSEDGKRVKNTKNFLIDPQTTEDPYNRGYYFIGYRAAREGVNDPLATANPPYAITYISSTDYFAVSLLKEPLRQTREQAEQYLMEKTGYDYGTMCHLKYTVSVPNSVSQTHAGQNLGWSFCPGAVQLP